MASGSSAPAKDGFAITKGANKLAKTPRSIYVGTGGDVHVNFKNSSDVIIFKNVGNGQILPISPTRILTATTAADIIGLL